jgi:hypothetical protein
MSKVKVTAKDYDFPTKSNERSCIFCNKVFELSAWFPVKGENIEVECPHANCKRTAILIACENGHKMIPKVG